VRYKKVRLRFAGRLAELLGNGEGLAHIPLDGTVRDLLDHLEDAYPAHAGAIRRARVELGGRAAGPEEAIPPRSEARLGGRPRFSTP
jgi:hypothetical protein